MTEAIYLALIALGQTLLFIVILFVLVIMILKQNPVSLKISWAKHGNVEVSFDPKAGK
ncbi:hypothetical protein [Longibaculum muris]|uniref:hypothetical protein n=1 Tax=Longibaculum muris TaxID=1796628 RepID=UPI00189F1E98|nr:hypothetical protein [Longibaculum muris]